MERAWAAERAGHSIIHLEAGEPDFGTPGPVVAAATSAIAKGDVHYTPSLGIPELRRAISTYYLDRYDVHVAPERVVVTTGASAALLLAFAAVINPGDSILMSDPGYPCNRNLLRICEGATDAIPVGPENQYQLSSVDVDRHWTQGTKGVLVGSPSNPTGSVIDEAELKAILQVCLEREGVSFIDEVYSELVYERQPTTALSLSEDIFVINSFSKQFGMTGWRLGWLVCPEWAIDAIRTLQQNIYISPPMPAQAARVAAFTPEVWELVEQRRREFQLRRDVLVAGLRDIGFQVPVMPSGGFYVYACCKEFTDDSSDLVLNVLDHAGVALAPGDDFGSFQATEHVRVSYTTSLENIREGLKRMREYLV